VAGPVETFTGAEQLKYGFPEEKKKSKNCQAQTPQAHERKPA
jgi:hypothetical protein